MEVQVVGGLKIVNLAHGPIQKSQPSKGVVEAEVEAEVAKLYQHSGSLMK